MNDKELTRLIRTLCRRVAPHVEVVLSRAETPKSKYSFDGKTLKATGKGLASKLHDVVHLLLASPKRRHAVEYGLGVDPYRDSDAECTVPLANDEEGYVCALQYALLLAIDRPKDAQRVAKELCMQELPDGAEILSIQKYRRDALPETWWKRCIEAVA